MQPVHGRTERTKGIRVWLVLPMVLLVSCQTRPPDQLPAEARVKVLFTDTSQHNRHLQKAMRSALGEQGELIRVRNRNKSIRKISSKLSQNPSVAVVALDSGAGSLLYKIPYYRFYFAQSFDYGPVARLGSRFRGVNIVPSPEAVFRILHALDPSLKTIGVVAGSELGPMIDLIERDAEKYSYTVIFRKAKNDRDFLYQSSLISKQADIYWLLPDSRILSGSAIKQFMRWTLKEGKPVISFTSSLLKLGALMSVEVDENAAASEVKRLLAMDMYGEGKNAPVMKYVRGINVRISRLSAVRLGIVVPTSLRAYQHD